jgi:hypothetical protein
MSATSERMPADDLLGRSLGDTERQLLAAYRSLRELLSAPDLPPTAVCGVRAALAQLWQPVTSLGLDYDQLGGFADDEV